jgi:hypothetical protein
MPWSRIALVCSLLTITAAAQASDAVLLSCKLGRDDVDTVTVRSATQGNVQVTSRASSGAEESWTLDKLWWERKILSVNRWMPDIIVSAVEESGKLTWSAQVCEDPDLPCVEIPVSCSGS